MNVEENRVGRQLSKSPKSSVARRPWIGIALAAASAALFALNSASASVAFHNGSNPLTVASVRFVLPALALFVWLRFSGISLLMPRRDRLVAAMLGFLNGDLFDGSPVRHTRGAPRASIAEPEADVRSYRERAARAEEWLHKIYIKVEERFIKRPEKRRSAAGAASGTRQ